MMSELENPFSVTKATEFTDNEINEYWVNFNTKDNISIDSMLNPTEFLPKYVIGGKGCGKTHILRYFSYPLQKIRANNDVNKILTKDKYIGLYSVFHGLNSSRFEGKGISDAEWMSIFEYYFELYICDNLLHTIKEVFAMINVESETEAKLIRNILKQFNNCEEITSVTTLVDLLDLLKQLRRKIDSQILNAAFTRKLNYEDVKVFFSPGDLIFGIPNIISTTLEVFKEVKFIYIFDEYEKLFEWQKKFVNSLVWDKKTPVTFWIGARRYGYTTRDTKSGESMKQGSEFHEVNLDVIIRSNEEIYKQFARQLYLNRLTKYYESKGLQMNPSEIEKQFCSRFEEYDESKIINQIVEKSKKREYKHLRELRKKISQAIKAGQAFEITDDSQIETIITSLTSNTNNDPVEQKYKIFLFYQLWYKAGKKSTFKNILEDINSEFNKYKSGKESAFAEIKDKRKKDLIAQLAKENNVKNTEYSGIEKFIDLSQGNARSFILILKKTIEFSKIRGEKPLEDGGRISLDTQYLAVYDTARWFYDDAELFGEKGKQMYYSLRCLSDYFMLNRFCDKPTETTVSVFYIKSEELSENALSCLELMKMHSIIIEDDDGRLEKNSGRKEKSFQLNKILAPLWNLPTVVRGSMYLNKETAESIFDFTQHKTFDKIYKERKSELNAPDFLKVSGSNNKANQLFE